MSLLASLLFVYAASAEPDGAEDARRLAAILDYVAGDYAAAVVDGKVVSEAEYAEQLAFLDDAASLARRLPPAEVDVAGAIERLTREVREVAPTPRVGADARALRRAVLDAYDVDVAPAGRPDHARGKVLYTEGCAGCHGVTGAGDGSAGAGLDPRPRNFLADGDMRVASPTRAFNAITEGVPGTAMPAFTNLSASQRWDLAFYVFSLRFESEGGSGGDKVPWGGEPPTVAALADGTEAEFEAEIEAEFEAGSEGLSVEERALRVGWLRRWAPYAHDQGLLRTTRAGVAAGLAARAGGDRVEARRLIGEAYLSGFEPHEGALRQADPTLIPEVETAFLALRDQVGADGSEPAVQNSAAHLDELLARAEAALARPPASGAAFVGSFLIILREGVEAALLVLLILGVDRGSGSGRRAAAVHAGWTGALLAGLGTWWLSEHLLGITGASREIVEGVVALFAAACMLLASHWILARADGKRRAKALSKRLTDGSVGLGALAALSFGAVYREALEVVLFLKAIQLDTGGGTGMVAGAATAVALLMVFVAVALRLGRRLRPAPLLTGAGALLCVMAVVFVGKGLRALQEAGALTHHVFAGPVVELLGVYPTWETSIGQALVLGFLLVTAPPVLRGTRAEPPPAAARTRPD